MVPPDSHKVCSSWYSGAPRGTSNFAYRTITFSGKRFHVFLLSSVLPYWSPTTPYPKVGFGLFRFRSPLLAESFQFLLLRVLRCFSSPSSLHTPYVFRSKCPNKLGRVTPFGNRRIIECLLLTDAIACCSVLPRLLLPRHPLSALFNLGHARW